MSNQQTAAACQAAVLLYAFKFYPERNQQYTRVKLQWQLNYTAECLAEGAIGQSVSQQQ
jgi:hypothetical protein